MAGRKVELEYDRNQVAAEQVYARKICRDASWQGQYCCVPLCHCASRREEERDMIEFRFILSLTLPRTKKEL